MSAASGNAAASSHEKRAGFGKRFASGTLTSSAYVPFVRAAEDPPVRPGGVLARAPGEPRVDHDLLAGVAADAGAVGAGDERQRELVRGPGRVPDEQVAAVDRRRLQLDDDLARPRDGSSKSS